MFLCRKHIQDNFGGCRKVRAELLDDPFSAVSLPIAAMKTFIRSFLLRFTDYRFLSFRAQISYSIAQSS
jgi:hypothetical protein